MERVKLNIIISSVYKFSSKIIYMIPYWMEFDGYYFSYVSWIFLIRKLAWTSTDRHHTRNLYFPPWNSIALATLYWKFHVSQQEIGIRQLRPPPVCLGKRATLFTQVAVLEPHFRAIFTYISRSEANCISLCKILILYSGRILDRKSLQSI